jgi:hypothetical protein
VEVLAQGLEAERTAVLDELEVCLLAAEVVDDQRGLLLDELVDLLQRADLWVGAQVLVLEVIRSDRCCTKALL